MIYLITGGERSGKSSYAQRFALELSSSPVYVATARRWDFEKRIERHQGERDERWTSIEEEKEFGNLELTNRVAVIDCVTLWLTNFFVDTKNNIEESLVEQKQHLKR